MKPKICHKGQFNFLKLVDKGKYRFYSVPSGRRFGKTTLISDVERPLIEPALLGKKIAVFVPDLKDGSRIFDSTKVIYARLIKKKSDTSKVIQFKNGGELYIFPINDQRKKDNGRGGGFARIIYEEFGKVNDDIARYHFDMVTKPLMLDYKDSDCFFIGTANHHGSFFHLLCEKGNRKECSDLRVLLKDDGSWLYPKYITYRLPSSANDTLDRETLAEMISEMSTDAVESEIYCKFLDYSGQIWCNALKFEGAKEKVFIKNTKVFWTQPIYLSFDMNMQPMTSILAQIDDPKIPLPFKSGLFPKIVTVKKEFSTDIKTRESIYQQCRLIREYIYAETGIKIGMWDDRQYGCSLPILITGDATSDRGDGRQREPVGYYEIICEELGVLPHNIHVPASNPYHVESYVQVNSMIEKSSHLLIDKINCPELTRDIQLTKMNPDRTIYKNDTARSHFLDCLRYLLWNFNRLDF